MLVAELREANKVFAPTCFSVLLCHLPPPSPPKWSAEFAAGQKFMESLAESEQPVMKTPHP